MKISRNRTVFGVICILLSLTICYGVTPTFTHSASGKTTVLRVSAPIAGGDEFTKDVVETLSDEPAAENAYLYDPDGGKQAMETAPGSTEEPEASVTNEESEAAKDEF